MKVAFVVNEEDKREFARKMSELHHVNVSESDVDEFLAWTECGTNRTLDFKFEVFLETKLPPAIAIEPVIPASGMESFKDRIVEKMNRTARGIKMARSE